MGDRGSAAGGANTEDFVEANFAEGPNVEAAMAEEVSVFKGYGGVDESGGDFFEGDFFAVFFAVNGVEEFAFAVVDFSGFCGVEVFEVGDIWQADGEDDD